MRGGGCGGARAARKRSPIMLFDDGSGLLRVLLVSVAAYAALVFVLRLAGKRSLAKLNAFDLVVTVALGSTLATVLLSKDVPLAEGILAFVMLAALQFVVAWASLRWHPFKKLVRSTPTLVVEDGRYLEAAMRRERLTQGEVDAAARKAGIGRIEELAAVVLETDGSFSVIRRADAGELTALRSVKRD
jgi:uncharacterized membrane protein YcaP (DUF421 family)